MLGEDLWAHHYPSTATWQGCTGLALLSVCGCAHMVGCPLVLGDPPARGKQDAELRGAVRLAGIH